MILGVVGTREALGQPAASPRRESQTMVKPPLTESVWPVM